MISPRKLFFCAILLLSFMAAGLKAEDPLAVVKSYKHGVVAIFPSSGDIKFFTNAPRQDDYYEDYQIRSVDRCNDNLVVFYYKHTGNRTWSNVLLMLNLYDYSTTVFDPGSTGNVISVSEHLVQDKGTIAVKLVDLAGGNEHWVLYSLNAREIVSNNFTATSKKRYDINKLKKWRNEWSQNENILSAYSDETSLALEQKSKFYWNGPYFMITHASMDQKDIMLFNGGPLSASDSSSLAFNLSEYSYFINGLNDQPWFCCMQTSVYDLRPDYEEFKNFERSAVQSDKPMISKEIAVALFLDYIRSAISLNDNILRINNMSNMKDFINRKIKFNARYAWIDETIFFEFEQQNAKISFPLRIRMAIDLALPLDKPEMPLLPCTFKSPVIWFTITKGKASKMDCDNFEF